MRECTHNQGLVPAALCTVGLTGRLERRYGRALQRRVPHLLATLIALELGLLSPLCCVIHCFVQQLLAERPAIALFLCGEHAWESVLSGGTLPGVPETATSSTATPTPRALYELVSLTRPILVAAGLLVAILVLRPSCRPVPLILPPPTPPPRLSLA